MRFAGSNRTLASVAFSYPHSAREVDVYPAPKGREGGVTLRVVVLCLTLAVVFGYALPVIDYKIYNTFLGGSHLPAGAVGVLLCC